MTTTSARSWFSGLFAHSRPASRRSRRSTGPSPRRLAAPETLEGREMMAADYLVIDFTPDAVPGERVQANSLVSTFVQVKDRYGRIPAFFDFNGNRRLDVDDVNRAVNQITNKVQQLFGNSVNVLSGDTWRDSNWGQRFLAWGQNSESLVNVVYTGGWDTNPRQRPNGQGVWGVAFQAPTGTSYEYHSYTFTSQIAHQLAQTTPWISPTYFANSVAHTIAHEAGHLLGLGHVQGNPRGDSNLMNYSSDRNTADIPNRWYNNIELTDNWGRSFYGWQNPWQEVVASYTSQAHITPSQLGKPAYLTLVTGDHILGNSSDPGHSHGDDHDHGHDEEQHHDHEHSGLDGDSLTPGGDEDHVDRPTLEVIVNEEYRDGEPQIEFIQSSLISHVNSTDSDLDQDGHDDPLEDREPVRPIGHRTRVSDWMRTRLNRAVDRILGELGQRSADTTDDPISTTPTSGGDDHQHGDDHDHDSGHETNRPADDASSSGTSAADRIRARLDALRAGANDDDRTDRLENLDRLFADSLTNGLSDRLQRILDRI